MIRQFLTKKVKFFLIGFFLISFGLILSPRLAKADPASCIWQWQIDKWVWVCEGPQSPNEEPTVEPQDPVLVAPSCIWQWQYDHWVWFCENIEKTAGTTTTTPEVNNDTNTSTESVSCIWQWQYDHWVWTCDTEQSENNPPDVTPISTSSTAQVGDTCIWQWQYDHWVWTCGEEQSPVDDGDDEVFQCIDGEYDFCDDFNNGTEMDTDKWQTITISGDLDWTQDNGYLERGKAVTNLTFTDFTYETLVNPAPLTSGADPVFRYQDRDNFYFFQIRPADSEHPYGQIVPHIRINGDWQISDPIWNENITINSGTWYVYKIVGVGNNFKFYINDVFIGEWTDADNYFSSGYIGFRPEFYTHGVKYDYVRINNYENGDNGDGDDEEENGGNNGETTNTTTEPHNLSLFAEMASDHTTYSITISWQTNVPATSRVVWGTYSVTSTDLCPEGMATGTCLYGYEFTTVEDPTMVTSHSVTISGLAPSHIYYLRPISHASPEEAGVEVIAETFAIGGGGGTVGSGDSGNSGNSGSGSSGTSTVEGIGGNTTDANSSTPKLEVLGEKITGDNSTESSSGTTDETNGVGGEAPKAVAGYTTLPAAGIDYTVYVLSLILAGVCFGSVRVMKRRQE